MLKTSGITCGTMAVLLFGLSPAVATAQSSVRGAGEITILHGAVDGGNLFRVVAVNAWIDKNGVAQGTMEWNGDVFQPLPDGNVGFGGPSDPFHIDVFDITFSTDSEGGVTATVTGVVTSSPHGVGDGAIITFVFTDNDAIGAPDELNDIPVDAGNYTIS